MQTLNAVGLVLIPLLLAPGSGQKISFARHYQVGATDIYALEITSPGGPGQDQRITMTSTQTVEKVYKDGGADISFTASNMILTTGGKPMAVGLVRDNSETMRVTNVGSPNELSDHNPVRISWEAHVCEGLAALKRGLAVGGAARFESVDPPRTNLHTSGKVRLVEVKDGVVRLTVVAEETMSGSQHVEHVAGTYWIRISTAILENADFTATGLLPGEKSSRVLMTRRSG